MRGTDETFERCAKWLLERPGSGWMVVHGTVNGRGQMDDEQYPQAWLEFPTTGLALDMNTDTPILVERKKYLDIVNAEPAAQYDVTGLQLSIELHQTYGPWDHGESKPPEKRKIH